MKSSKNDDIHLRMMTKTSKMSKTMMTKKNSVEWNF